MAGQPIPTSGARALADRLAAIEAQLASLRAGATSGFTSAVDDLAAQVAWLASQAVTFASEKPEWITGDTSGTGSYESLAWDETYDDMWQVETSSTGLLKLDLSASLLINNGDATDWAGSAVQVVDGDGVALTGISLQGVNSGALWVPAARSAVVTCPANSVVTLRTIRRVKAPVSPKTSWHGSQSVTLTVTKIGM